MRIALAGLIGVLGTVNLTGWAAGRDGLLLRLGRHYVSMKPLTSVSFVALGVAIALLPTGRHPARAWPSLAGGGGVAAIGALTAAEYLTGRSLPGFDRLLFAGPLRHEPGLDRMSLETAVAVVLLGAAVMAAAAGGRWRAAVPVLAAGAGAVGYVAGLGYIYGVTSLYQIEAYTAIAVPTTVSLLAASLALLLAVPERPPVSMVCDRGCGGKLTRHLAPVVLVGMPVAGWLSLLGERAGLYHAAFGTALMAMALVAIFAVLNWAAYREIARSEAALVQANLSLERRVAERTMALAAVVEAETLAAGAARGAATATDVGSAAVAFAEVVRRVVPIDGLTVAVHDGGAVAEVVGAWGDVSWPASLQDRFRLDELPHWPAFLEGRSVAGSETTRRGTRCYLAVPMLARGEVWGLISFTRSRPNAFTPEQIALCEGCARAAGGAFNIVVLLDRERQAAERLRVLDRMKNDFVGVLAHDLRSPIAVITGLARIVRQRWPRLSDAERNQFLDRIVRNTDHLSELAGDVLEVAYIESGTVDYEAEPFDIAQLALRTVNELTSAADRACEITVGAEVPLVVGDRSKTWRVLANLISNALKFSPADAPIAVEIGVCGPDVEVTVTDHGPGFTTDERDLLFQKFARLSGSANGAPPEGTGLGLYIARSFIEGQHGRIWAWSTPGQGATFGFSLPTMRAAATVPAPHRVA